MTWFIAFSLCYIVFMLVDITAILRDEHAEACATRITQGRMTCDCRR